MAVIRLDIQSRQPYTDGKRFGDAGAYERLDGTIHFAVNPAHAANRRIVDLDTAARDADGRVHFSADFCLLQPTDAARGNRRLLFEVLNRGKKLVPRMFNHADPEETPTNAIDPGDGFLFRHGYSVAWCGWQWDVALSDALMGLDAPAALDDHGAEIVGQVLVWHRPNEPANALLLADRDHAPYPAADVHDPDAVLSVRDSPAGPATVISRDRWRFARDEGGAAVPDDTFVWLDGGFVPGKVYEVVYRTRRCPVVGTGMLAVRDTVAFLRSDARDNPCAGRIDTTYGFGMSQSGRLLRHFLYDGLNMDEQGRQVFDGLFIHVAGGRRGEFNHRYAQPSQQHIPSFGHLFPFADDAYTDAATGVTDGLLHRQREIGGVPKIVTTNTDAEYWRGDCSLIHTTPDGTRDIEPPPEVRIYHFAGTQHGLGTLPLHDGGSPDGARGTHPLNSVDYIALMRAALVNLDQWVTAGIAPPPSRFPRLADGTAVPMPTALAPFRTIPGASVPVSETLPNIRHLSLGAEAAHGVGRYPAVMGEPYPVFVSAVDADGNEMAGIRLPDLTVPVATQTGWNPRHPATGAPEQLIPMQGSTLPFAATVAVREHRHDPRPAIAERYRDRNEYLARVRAAADALIADGFVLADDLPLLIALAAERYDAFAVE